MIAAGILVLLVYWVCEALAKGASGTETGRIRSLQVVMAESEEESPVLDLHAVGAVLMDGYTGRVLYEKNGSRVLPMASTTKIMTCIIALENGEPDELVEVSAYAASMPDVQLGIVKGEKYRLGDLMLSLMLESHNDSAVAIAEYIASKQVSENGYDAESGQPADASLRTVEESKALVDIFAKLMNEKAKEIGCENTYFITPNGLDAAVNSRDENGRPVEHVHSTTAAELALIMRYCLSQSEESDTFLEVTQTREAVFTDETGKRSFSCINHNRYLDMNEGAVSGKTGFTGKAGYCYVGAVNQDGMFLIAALLACGWPPSKNLKWQDMNTLMDYGLENYSCIQVTEPAENSVPYLVNDTVENGRGLVQVLTKISFEPFSVLLKTGETLTESWYLEPKAADTGEIVGEYRFMVNGIECKNFPIVSSQENIWDNK